jgi:hypothetical protein
VASSWKPFGRLDFVLRILLISVLAFALEYFLRGDAFLYLNYLPRNLRAFPRVAAFLLVAFFSVTSIDGRLLDSGLPSWYTYPTFTVWLLSIEIPINWSRQWPIALALFVLLLIAGGLIPSQQMPLKPLSEDKIAEDDKKTVALDRTIPPRLLIGPVSFLRTLLTFACFGLPLIWLESLFGHGVGALIAHLGYGVLYLLWLFKVLGRFADSGRPSNWYWFPFCIAVSIASALPLWFKLINRYETLALFLLIQVPLALLESKQRSKEPTRSESRGDKYKKRHGKGARPFLVSPFAFVLRIWVIGCLWSLLIYMESGSGDEIVVWFARIGYFILGVVWMVNANGRLENAGWAHSWYPSQYFLVVSVASLMPLAVHWVNGYEALAIFALIQTPTVWLRSKPKPEEPLLETDGQVARV